MILVRNIFQAEFGKAGELAKTMKASAELMGKMYGGKARVFTDLSGTYDTVVLEIEVESLGTWEQKRAEMFASPEFASQMEEIASGSNLITGGRAEFFTIE